MGQRDYNILAKYLDEMSQYQVLPEEQSRALAVKSYNGDIDARNKLVLHNLRCAVGICIKYHKLYPEVQELDLISEAHCALIDAAREFDIFRGTKFITYAYWCVRNRVIKYLRENLFPCRLPASVVKKIQILKRYLDLTKRVDENPSIKELSTVISTSEKTCKKLLYFVELDNDPKPNYYTNGYRRIEFVRDIENHLPNDEAYIIKRITGIDGFPPSKQREIAEDLGISDELVKQKKQKGLNRLAQLYSKSDILLESMARMAAKRKNEFKCVGENNMVDLTLVRSTEGLRKQLDNAQDDIDEYLVSNDGHKLFTVPIKSHSHIDESGFLDLSCLR